MAARQSRRRGITAAVKLAVHNETAAYSCSECYAYQAATVAAGHRNGSSAGKTVGVVIHGDIHAEAPAIKSLKMHLAPQKDIGGVVHYAAHRVDKVRNSDADAIDIRGVMLRSINDASASSTTFSLSREGQGTISLAMIVSRQRSDTHVGSPRSMPNFIDNVVLG